MEGMFWRVQTGIIQITKKINELCAAKAFTFYIGYIYFDIFRRFRVPNTLQWFFFFFFFLSKKSEREKKNTDASLTINA
jgi:hypothetical protein